MASRRVRWSDTRLPSRSNPTKSMPGFRTFRTCATARSSAANGLPALGISSPAMVPTWSATSRSRAGRTYPTATWPRWRWSGPPTASAPRDRSHRPLRRLRYDERPDPVEADVGVQPFTRIEGPCFVGRDTQLFRANLRGGVTLGPNCRIGGEVEEAIVHGHSNKYHEGFLGHAYVGEWVNLGAITSNSDLRNDYGEVAVPLQGDPIPTGQAKVGCFIGDHTRTGMGSMLNTGTAIGVMCNVLPAGPLLPKHVPSFSSVLYGRVAPGFALATCSRRPAP